MKRMFVIALVLSLVLPAVTNAGDSHDNWLTLQSIRPGQRLIVKTFSGRSLKGSFQRVTNSELDINTDGKEVDIPTAEVSQVYVLGGRQIVKGTLIGAAIGTAAGAGMGAVAGRESKTGWNFFGQGAVTAMGAGLGFIAGSVAGLAIGASRNKKVLVYKAAPPR